MNIVIMRAFVKLRELLATHKALAHRIEQLTVHDKDRAALFDIVIGDIQKLDRKFSQEFRRLKNPRRRKPPRSPIGRARHASLAAVRASRRAVE